MTRILNILQIWKCLTLSIRLVKKATEFAVEALEAFGKQVEQVLKLTTSSEINIIFGGF